MEGAYYHTDDSADEYIRLAEGHSGANLIEQFKKFLAANSSVLEIGSGPGTDWEILKDDFDVTGSDNSKAFLKRLSVKYPNEAFLQLDAATLAVDQTFDGIYSNKVLHHLQDDELQASIKKQQALLTPGGLVCHSFWKGTDSEVFKGMFVNYHTVADIQSYFGKYFETLLLEEYPEFEAGDSLLYIGRKNSRKKN